MKFSSAADYHPGAPKVVEGNAALMDKSDFKWNDYPVRGISDPETKTNPNPKSVFGGSVNPKPPFSKKSFGGDSALDAKGMENSGYANGSTAGLVKGAKTSGGGGNSGAVVSQSPELGLSAYQDPNVKVGQLPKRQSGGI